MSRFFMVQCVDLGQFRSSNVKNHGAKR